MDGLFCRHHVTVDPLSWLDPWFFFLMFFQYQVIKENIRRKYCFESNDEAR